MVALSRAVRAVPEPLPPLFLVVEMDRKLTLDFPPQDLF